MEPFLFIVICLAVFFGLEGAYEVAHASRRRGRPLFQARLRKLGERVSGSEKEQRETILRAAKGLTAGMLSRQLPFGKVAVERQLYRAGSLLGVGRFFALTAVLAVAGFALATQLLGHPLLGAIGVLLGFVPHVVVRRAASQRMARFADDLPEALELVTRSLRAGHALVTGFQIVGDELADPVATEFAVVAEELRMGVDLRDALQGMVHRVDNPDLPYFVTAVLIQRQTGGNLAEVLGNLGGLLRERSQFFGKVRAMTAQGRGAALILALWMPFITFVVGYVAPDYLAPLLENTWGHMILVGCAVLDVTGYLMARSFATVEP